MITQQKRSRLLLTVWNLWVERGHDQLKRTANSRAAYGLLHSILFQKSVTWRIYDWKLQDKCDKEKEMWADVERDRTDVIGWEAETGAAQFNVACC